MKGYVVKITNRDYNVEYYYRNYARESWIFDPEFDNEFFTIYSKREDAEDILEMCQRWAKKEKLDRNFEVVEVDLNFKV